MIRVAQGDAQAEQAVWARRNFGVVPSWHPLLGVVEEVGELSHAHLKAAQGIRTDENHAENAKDAVGDIMIYLMHYCTLNGWCMETILFDTWDKVKNRDWKTHKENGTKAL